MKKFFWILVLAVLAYGGYQVVNVFTTKSRLTARVVESLDAVGENASANAVLRRNLVAEAEKWGVELRPEDVKISFVNATEQTFAQQKLGKVGEFQNKMARIELEYRVPVLGFEWTQRIAEQKLHMVGAQRKAPASVPDF
jgi:hypothetical protein